MIHESIDYIYWPWNIISREYVNFDDAEEAESYRKLRKLFQTPTEIMEIFKALIFPKDNAQPILDGSTNQTVTKSFSALF